MTLTLVFQMAGQDYGLEIDAVQEIIESPAVYPVPKGGHLLKGVLNVHGEVLPVVDLPALLNFSDASRDERIIVLSPEFRSLALVVCKVGRILPLDLEQLMESVDVGADRCVRGVIEREDEGPVHLLDTDAVFGRLERIFKEYGGDYGPECDDRG
jgi:purine-binding chemotaxis protein CheW